MSLLFDHAIERFEVEEATLYEAAEAEMEPTGEGVPVGPIVSFARQHSSLEHPDSDWVCLPLHTADRAGPTDQYVAYKDDELRGDIVVFECGGDREFLSLESFARTPIADRIRFWHSDYIPAETPESYDSAVDDHEPPRNPTEPDALLENFAAYVDGEREATRDASRQRARQRSPETIYREDGGAIPALDCVDRCDGSKYQFRVDLPPELADEREQGWQYFVENEFGIHQGNEVLLHAPEAATSPEAFPLPGEVTKIRGLDVWIRVDLSSVDDVGIVDNDVSPRYAGYGLSVLLNPVPFDRERDAIDRLEDHRLLDVLAGTRPITFTNGAAARSSGFDEELNQEQQTAVRHALLADDLFCIHGPPGTGKSRTLVEIVRRAVDAGESVLVCADSNQAVDNLVVGGSTRRESDPDSLHARSQHHDGEFVLDRKNAGRSTNALVRERYGDVEGLADVVAATNSTTGTLAREFDLVVVDEATQATCTSACIPLTAGDRVVLAGDHKQLPPYSATEEPPDSNYGLSLFEHLYAEGGVFEGVGVQLRTQYRMHRDVAHFPNRRFYDRSLRPGRDVLTLDDRPPLEGYDIGGTVETVDHSKKNATEARLVTHLVDGLLEDLPPDEVGVITPYSAQVFEIREWIEDHLDDAGRVTVDTIDSFQGSERTAIVISLVRSNGEGELGFLGRPQDGPRRLNVALTRAQQYCAIVADWHTLRYDQDGKCTDLYQDVYSFFRQTGRLNRVDPEFVPL